MNTPTAHRILRTKRGPLDAVATDKHVVVYAPSVDVKSSFQIVNESIIDALNNNNFVPFNSHADLVLCFDGSVVNMYKREVVFTLDFLKNRQSGDEEGQIAAIALSKCDEIGFAVDRAGKNIFSFEISSVAGKVHTTEIEPPVEVKTEASTATSSSHASSSLSVSPNGKYLAVCNPARDDTVIFDIHVSAENKHAPPGRLCRVLAEDAHEVVDAAFSADSKSLYTVSNNSKDGSAKLLSLEVANDGKQNRDPLVFDEMLTKGRAVAVVSSAYDLIAVSFDNGDIIIVDTEKWQVHARSPLRIETSSSSARSPQQLCFHPTSDNVLVSFDASRGQLHIWSTHVGEVSKTIECGMTQGRRSNLSFSANGMELLVSVSSAQIVRHAFVLGVVLPNAKSVLCETTVARMSFSTHCGSLDVEDLNGKTYSLQMEGFLAQGHVERANALKEHAASCLKVGDFRGALEKYSAALLLEPYDSSLFLGRSRAFSAAAVAGPTAIQRKSAIEFAQLDAANAKKFSSDDYDAQIDAQVGLASAVASFAKAARQANGGALNEDFVEVAKKMNAFVAKC